MNHSESEPLRRSTSSEHDDTISINERELFVPPPKPNRTKFCFSVCGLVCILFGIGVLLSCYFFWPRYPKIGLIDVSIDKDSHPTDGTRHLISSLSEDSNKIELGLVLHLYANSSLFFNLKVQNISSDGFIKVNNGDFVYIGTGYLKEPITIPSRTQLYKFDLPFKLQYDKTVTNSETNRALHEFLNKCGMNGKPSVPSRLKYVAEASIPLLFWSDHKAKFEKELDFTCPFNLQFFGKVKHLFEKLFE